jgi:hypothetical protein
MITPALLLIVLAGAACPAAFVLVIHHFLKDA